MDPLTITSTVIALSARCVRSARGLYELRAKYRDASLTISAIYSESNVIATSLACIQGLCTNNPDALQSTLQARPEIVETFDQALTGCVLVYSVLEDEVQRLYSGIQQDGFAGSVGRMKLLWKEESMQEVLTQIRGQQTALGLLINVLQLNSIHEVHTMLQDHVETFENTAQRLIKFRRANPRVKAPSSVFELAMADDVASLYSVDSVATSTDFAFDDLVTSSGAYRRALAQAQSTTFLAPVQERSETSSNSGTVVGTEFPDSLPKYDVPPNVRQRLPPTLLTVLHGWIDELVAERIREEKNRQCEYWESQTRELRMHHEEVVETRKEEHTAAYSLLFEKYQKVKRYYFEIEDIRSKQQNQIEALTADYDRLLAEKADVDHERVFLQEERQRNTDFLAENENKRNLLAEAHRKQLDTREATIADLKSSCEGMKEDLEALNKNLAEGKIEAEGLKSDLTLQKAKVLELENALDVSEVEKREIELRLSATVAEKEQKEADLLRFKGFEKIFEQFRQLSPDPSTVTAS